MPPPIASMPPHMVPPSVNRQMYHHQYHSTLARRQMRQQQLASGDSDAETTPICRCRVIYLGSSVPHVTKDGLQGIQEPLRDLYPEQGLLASATTESIGIDSWLSVWSNGILIENVDDSGREMKKFFPIDSLHYCAAVRYVVIPGANIDSGPTFGNTLTSTTTTTNTGTKLPSGGNMNGLDSLHSKSSFNGDPVSGNAGTDAGEATASTGTSQHHHQQQHQHQQPSSLPHQHHQLNSSAGTSPATSSSHGQNGHGAPVVTADAKIKFLPLDSPFSANSNTSIHPPLFACILRRTTGIKVLECHAFICKRDQAANALVRCCFHAYADSMHAKQMEAEMENEQESTYGPISLTGDHHPHPHPHSHPHNQHHRPSAAMRRHLAVNGNSPSPGGPSNDSLVNGSVNYRASSSSSSNAQVNGKSRPQAQTRHHKRSINGSTISGGQGSIHLNDSSANRFSRSISDLDSVENKIEAWRQRSTEALNMEAQQQQSQNQNQQQQQNKSIAAEIHTESSGLCRSRRALSSGAIAVQGPTLAEYRRRRSDDQYSDEEVEAIVDDEDDDDEEDESAHGPKRVSNNRNHLEGVYDNLDDEDEVDEDEDGNYKVWHGRRRRGTDSGVGGVRSSESTIGDAAVPTIRSARYPPSLMYPGAISTPHLPSLPPNHPMYHPGHYSHRGTLVRSGHLPPMGPPHHHLPPPPHHMGHIALAPVPFPPHHPPPHPYIMDGRATLRSVRTTASSNLPSHFASGTLGPSGLARPASVAASRSMINLGPSGTLGPLMSPPPHGPFLGPPPGSPFFPVPSTLSKKELKNLKNTMKKLKKKNKGKGVPGDFIPLSPPPPPHLVRPPVGPFGHPSAHPPPPFPLAVHPASGRPLPMLMMPHPHHGHPHPPPPHMLHLGDEPIYVPSLRPMTPMSIRPDSSIYNGGGHGANGTNGNGRVMKDSKNGNAINGKLNGKSSSKESSSSRRNSSSPGESVSASGSKNNLLHQNYPSVHHSSSNRTCQMDSASEQEVHSDSSGFNTGGIYRKKANLNERAFSYSIRQESRSRSNSLANVNFPPHSLASGDDDSPASLAINGNSYSSTASSSLNNAMNHSSLIHNGIHSGGGKNHSNNCNSVAKSAINDQVNASQRQQQQQVQKSPEINYYNQQQQQQQQQQQTKYSNSKMYNDDCNAIGDCNSTLLAQNFDNLTLNCDSSYVKRNGHTSNGQEGEMYYHNNHHHHQHQQQVAHLAKRHQNGHHDSSISGKQQQQQMNGGVGGGGGNRSESSLSSSTLQGNIKTASIKRGSGLSLHQLHASLASSNGTIGAGSTTSGSKIAMTPVPPIPPHLLSNGNGNSNSTNGNTSGHINGGSKVNSRSTSRENL